MRDRLLIRHFLWRFLEHDLISPATDKRVALSAIGGTLIALSLFVAILMATPYVFSNDMPPGMVSLSSLDDRFLFASASMLVMALVAVAQWDALALDTRDASALGLLPIPRAVIVRTKLTAVAVLGIGVAVAWNVVPTILRSVAVPAGLRVSLIGALILTTAHAVATCAAGAFGFLAVLGLREVSSAMVGPARFQRISATLQATLVVALATALLLLPGANGNVARNWMARGGLTARTLPPLWFVGLNETLAGSVIDALPRTRPERLTFGDRRYSLSLAVADRNATNLYRSLWPLYHELALVGIAMLIIVAVVTTAACMWNSRRLPIPVVRRAHEDGAAGRAWKWMVAHVVARTSLRQAGFFFTLQTLSRRVSHRVPMAAAWAIGLALIVVAASGARWADVQDVGSIPVAILAAQSLLLGSVLNGFRRATRVPSELGASSTFSLAWSGRAGPFISGVKRAGWIAVVAPALVGLTVWHTAILGPRLAALHLGVGISLSALVMETMFLRDRRVPFVNGYAPSVDVKLRMVGYLVALLSGSFALAWIERLSFRTATGYVALLTALLGLSLSVAAFDRTFSGAAPTLDPDEEPPLPTQRLNLAQ
jgi:hypothetical protein